MELFDDKSLAHQDNRFALMQEPWRPVMTSSKDTQKYYCARKRPKSGMHGSNTSKHIENRPKGTSTDIECFGTVCKEALLLSSMRGGEEEKRIYATRRV